ncbi:MAG: hypothetical protein PHR35_10660 [Kiritimatiellae bacterium]|nr:hypothetical protein [Kiritimatiellia bacterium]
MRKHRTCDMIVAGIVWLLAASGGQAGAISILNPSFESPAMTSASGTYLTPTSWSKGGECGMWFLGQAGGPGINMTSVPDGNQALWSNGGYFYQVLDTSLQANTLYTMTIHAGKRSDVGFGSSASIRLGYGSVYGTNVLTAVAVRCPTPLSRAWTNWSVKFVTGTNPAGLGQPLRVDLNMGGSQPLFDNVQLTADPVTNTGTLMIDNPSFEEPVSTSVNMRPSIGWTWAVGIDGGVANTNMGSIYSAIRDGSQALWGNNSGLYQIIAATLCPNMVYTLTARVCARTDQGFGTTASVKLGYGSSYGSNLLTQATTDCAIPALGTSSIWKIVFVSGATPAGLDEPLRVDINLSGVQPYFDSVALTAEPVSNEGNLLIINGSFESPTPLANADNAYGLRATPALWTKTGAESGMFALGMTVGTGDHVASVPDGSQGIWANGGAFYQTIPATLQANMRYTLTAYAGARDDLGFKTAVYGPVTINLGYGNTYGVNYLTPVSTNFPTPGYGQWKLWTAKYVTGSSPVGLEQPLRVELNTAAVQPLFDHVQLLAERIAPGTAIVLR